MTPVLYQSNKHMSLLLAALTIIPDIKSDLRDRLPGTCAKGFIQSFVTDSKV